MVCLQTSRHIRVTRARHKELQPLLINVTIDTEIEIFSAILLCIAIVRKSLFVNYGKLLYSFSHVVCTYIMCRLNNARQALDLSSICLSVIYCCRYFGVSL